MERPGGFSFSAVCALHLTTLFTLAVAHPLYEVLGREDHATFFAERHAEPLDIWLLVLAVSVLIPLADFAILWMIAGVSRRLASGLYIAALFVLFAALFFPILERLLPAFANLSALLALAAAVFACLLYVRSRLGRRFVTVMSPAIVLSPVLFLSGGSVGSFLSSPGAEGEDRIFRPTELPGIVMLIFDEIPLTSLLDEERQIDPVRYPNFARLAGTSTWYRDTTALHYSTWIAVPSILIGSDFYAYTERLQLNDLTGKLDRRRLPFSLFTLFEDTHRVVALESFTDIAPQGDAIRVYRPPLSRRFPDLLADASVLYAHAVAPERLRSRLPPWTGGWQGLVGTTETDAAATLPSWSYRGKKAEEVAQLLGSFERRSGPPTLYLAHLSLPHFPFTYNERGQEHEDKFKIPDARFRKATGEDLWAGETAAALAYQAHLLQLGFTDLLLGQILDRLEELELFDASLVVVTADHGGSFYWNGGGLPAEELAAIQASDTLHVPFIVKAPHQKQGEISDRAVQLVDVVPTVADMLGIEIPWGVDGVSARVGPPPERKTVGYLTSHTLRMEFGSLAEGANRSLAHKLDLFGSRDLAGVYAYGPRKELVGEPVEAFPATTSPATLELTGRESFRKVDPSGSRVPGYVQGEITYPAEIEEGFELELAVAINGVIASTTRTTRLSAEELVRNDPEASRDDRKLHFLARVPADRLVPGENRVGVYAIEGDADGRPALMSFSRE